MRLPSGDQTGEESLRAPEVNSRTREPSTSTIQRLLRYWSLTLSTQVRVKMICLPSGEISGLPTDSMFMKVSLSRSRGFGCANAAAQRASRTAITNRRRIFIVTSIQNVQSGRAIEARQGRLSARCLQNGFQKFSLGMREEATRYLISWPHSPRRHHIKVGADQL